MVGIVAVGPYEPKVYACPYLLTSPYEKPNAWCFRGHRFGISFRKHARAQIEVALLYVVGAQVHQRSGHIGVNCEGPLKNFDALLIVPSDLQRCPQVIEDREVIWD